jgi:adenylate kinase
MKTIQLHDLKFELFISKEELANIVKTLVYQVSHDLEEGDVPIFIGILNGSFLYVADFVRQFEGPCEVSFVKLHSYQGTSSTETVNELIGINEDLTNRTVVILEDIVDTGNTLHKIYDIFRDKNVKQLKIATLFFKPTVYRKELPIDYIGKNIEDKFIVGYGLDYNGLGRNLPAIYQLKTAE